MKFLNELFSNQGINVFEEFDTGKHDFQILIRNTREENSQLNFFLDNKNSIKKVSRKWKLSLADGVCRGGYDYSISVYKGSQLDQLAFVCFKCNRWAIQNSKNPEKSLFEITEDKFHTFLRKYFEPIEIKMLKFDNKKEALEFWEKEQNNLRLIKQPQLLSDWIKFEGEYTLNFSINKGDGEDKPSEYLENKLKMLGECGEYQFGQIMAMGIGEEYKFTFLMKSSKKLFDKIDESEPDMLLKNQGEKPKGFFNKGWKEFSDFSLKLYYKR